MAGGVSPLLGPRQAADIPLNIVVSGGDFGGQGEGGDEERGVGGGLGGGTSAEQDVSWMGGEGSLRRNSTTMTNGAEAEGSMMKRRLSAMSEGSQGHSLRGRRASKLVSPEELPGYNKKGAAGDGVKLEGKTMSLLPPPLPGKGGSVIQRLRDSGRSFRDAIKYCRPLSASCTCSPLLCCTSPILILPVRSCEAAGTFSCV